MTDQTVPADPPSPLTDEWLEGTKAIARKHPEALPFWIPADALIALCDAARAPDAGLRAAAQGLVDALDYEPGSWLGGKIALVRAALAAPAPAGEHTHIAWDGRSVLAPAPAGLDEIERLIAALKPRPNLQGSPVNAYCQARDDALLIVRAATRPAEDAGERP